MAISGQQVASSSTLETLRTQFNNLVTDVAAIEGGSISYTTLNTTTTNATTLNVKEDGTIVFEGATDDGFETTLTVVDPTADRTVTFPNASGTVIVSDSSTNVTTLPDDLLIKDGGTIGNASVADVLTLAFLCFFKSFFESEIFFFTSSFCFSIVLIDSLIEASLSSNAEIFLLYNIFSTIDLINLKNISNILFII